MQSSLTPSSVQAKTVHSTQQPATLSVHFLYLYSSFAVHSSVLQQSQQAERQNKKTSKEGLSSGKLLLFNYGPIQWRKWQLTM